MTVKTASLSVNTNGNTDIHDITRELTRLVERSGLRTGVLTVFCPSSTSALTTIEFEPGALTDLKRLFEELVPEGREYAHNDATRPYRVLREEGGNGHSHMRASLLGASLSIPFVEKALTLGIWQQVIHVDFDNRPRERELVVQMIGE